VIIVDTALERRHREGRPVRFGMVGAGAMGRGIALQTLSATPGMELVAISNRNPDAALRAYRDAGADDVRTVGSVPELERSIAAGAHAVTDDPSLLCQAAGIDAVLEVTGSIEFGAGVVMDAIAHGKHAVTMNAELQGTLGPILKTYAEEAGVVLTDSDGDQPGVIMNTFRFVRSIGCNPVLAGNIKGLHDPYRNPTTQEGFARRNGLAPHMAASFADGTKVSFEMAIVANATGFRVLERGMRGPHCEDVHDAERLFPPELFDAGGAVDYVVGAQPAPGVFVLGRQDDPVQRDYLRLYKRGDGPLYTFYRPYHLCHFEVPLTVARAVLFEDAAVTPLGPPVVEVVATAKRDLRAGETLDGIGHYATYGLCENADVAATERLLPMGLAVDCVLERDVPKDEVLTYDVVSLPPGRLCDRLRREQDERFGALEQPCLAPA
jgi:predicted homoserine dehydrogenase-like protein